MITLLILYNVADVDVHFCSFDPLCGRTKPQNMSIRTLRSQNLEGNWH